MLIFLDFDGHDVSGTAWNNTAGIDPLVTEPYDTDGVRDSFSQDELARTLESWQGPSRGDSGERLPA